MDLVKRYLAVKINTTLKYYSTEIYRSTELRLKTLLTGSFLSYIGKLFQLQTLYSVE